MNSGRLHRTVAAVVAALALSSVAAAASANDIYEDPAKASTSPPILDLFVLRPVGLVTMGIGTALFCAPVMPLTLVSRPSDLDKPFRSLVVAPTRYVFADPLGEH